MQNTKFPVQESRADRFWSMFLFTKNGRVKNPLIIYSFSISIVLLLIYGLSFWFLVDPIHHLLGETSALTASLMESIVPPLASCALVCLMQKVSGNKRFIPAAHIWLLLYAMLTLVLMLVLLENVQDEKAFLSLFLKITAIPVLLGNLSTWLMYRTGNKHYKKMQPRTNTIKAG
ncbi:MAG: hypothetical protein GX858_04350 [Clostridiales bacterium]|nr:hypothetical protein [Clostridiales bacterium]